MEELLQKLMSSAYGICEKLVFAMLIAIAGAITVRIIKKIFKKEGTLKHVDPTAKRVIANFVTAAAQVLVIVLIISVLGVPMASIVAVIASAGVAVGLALQGSLSNLAGGIMLAIFKPFSIGDYVEIGSAAGTVTDVSVFYTTLKTPDNKKVVIPNGTVMSSNVTNYSSEDTRRVDINISAAYGTDVGQVISILEKLANDNILVLKDPAPAAYFNAHGQSSLDFVLRAWCKNADYWTVYFALTKSVNEAFKQNSIEIPYPQMDVHVKQ
ncbi:MAG: mechanosensitive ion channel [Ruminococcaceae bacterium]|nr:mechanosensitive ion channel [Oscillospiraceae bacterium]